MKVQLLDRYLHQKSSHHIFSRDITLNRIRINSIKTLTINLLQIYGEKQKVVQHFEWSIFDFNHRLEYKACKELVKEGKLVEIKKWYSLRHKFRLKTNTDFRKEKLKKINSINMGRCKERIPIILKHINWRDFISKSGFIDAYFKDLNCPDHLRDKNIDATKLQYTLLRISENINSIESYWSQNPDQRLIQVLVNMGIVENIPGAWYYMEETEYMITSHTLKPEEILFWGSYGKDGTQELRYILLKDMDSEHIEACLRTQKNMNQYYRKTMEKIMRLRKLQKLSE